MVDAATLANVREATSAQVDLNTLMADHGTWYRGSRDWGDYAKTNSAREPLI